MLRALTAIRHDKMVGVTLLLSNNTLNAAPLTLFIPVTNRVRGKEEAPSPPVADPLPKNKKSP